MKTFAAWVTTFAAVFLAGNLRAEVPQLISYQGRVAVGGVNFDGAGQFKFALVNGDGTTTFWSNDGASSAGSEPTAAVTLTVTKGLYSVLLGDTSLANMTAIPNAVFNNDDVRLRVWFNDGANGSQQLAPDQRIAAVGYAMVAGSVPNGAITSSMIANGAVGASKLAPGAAAASLNASGQSGVASGGLVLSATDNNLALTNAGYVKVGTIDAGGGSWQQRINTPSLESARYNHTAVWTGSEMIIWGGVPGSGSLNDGGGYNPATNRWTAVTTSGAPTARTSHSAVWTGSEMIVWGGDNGSDSNSTVNNGGRYNPAANTWTAMTTSDAPSRRSAHRAVWTGSEMIVWGGTTNGFNSLDDGGRYDPAGNTWTAMAATGAPSARQSHTAVWTGSEMIVWGGFTGFIPVIPLNDGRRYRPADNTWTAVTTNSAPVARYGHTAVWTGGEMIVYGGINGSNTWNDGGRYDPVGDSWTAVATNIAPAARAFHRAVWTGNEMIVWGGSLNGAYLNDGGRYNPAGNSWTAVAIAGAPAARWFHSAVWTGSAMIVWGGINATTPFNDGGRYNPVGNSWTSVAMTAPVARRNHTAVWTGSEMIVWGGNSNIPGSPFLNDGGRYNPVIDGWAAVNTAGAPAARAGHTAVWSGTEMIV